MKTKPERAAAQVALTGRTRIPLYGAYLAAALAVACALWVVDRDATARDESVARVAAVAEDLGARMDDLAEKSVSRELFLAEVRHIYESQEHRAEALRVRIDGLEALMQELQAELRLVRSERGGGE